MGSTDADFLKKLLLTFQVEAQEHLTTISSRLFELEKAPAEKQRELVEIIFREVHSLKGAARTVNKAEIEEICQSMENVFAGLKRQEILLTPALLDVLYQAVDGLGRFLSSSGAEQTPDEKSKMISLVRQLKSSLKVPPLPSRPEEPGKLESKKPPDVESATSIPGEGVPDEGQSQGEDRPPYSLEDKKPFVPEKPLRAEMVRISSTKLNSLLLQVEEMLAVKLTMRQRIADLKDLHTLLDLWRKEWTKVQPEVRRIRRFLERKNKRSGVRSGGYRGSARVPPPLPGRLLEFLDWNHTTLKSMASKLTTLTKSMEYDRRFLDGTVDHLLEDTKKVLLLPFSSFLEIFPKLVRELSRDLGKDVELVIQGGEIEIDKRILEEMKDALVHLIRNCIDHGIEDPKERARKKKPLRGTVTLSVSQKTSNNVEILISDDGAGIDISKVKSAAIKLGLVSQAEADKLNEREVLSFIFQSGISTSPFVTDISGRGLGLAIVREKVEKLGGLISVETYPHQGSTFRILLPLTFATFRGVLVQVGEQVFVVPSANVERVARIRREAVKTVGNRETITLDDRVVPLVGLAEVLELPQGEKKPEASPGREDPEFILVFVLGTAERRIAFGVDKVLNEQEVLVKSLGRQLSRVRNIAGATILGTGKAVPILNVPDLLKSAVKLTPGPSRIRSVAKEAGTKRKSILVVEDSITTRILLKNILESAGYQVKTVVDGVDALAALGAENFDLVVSDVDMPRMNGFDLTAKIRADQRLSELPVVLVTSLEDRERGLNVGANAYVVKRGFEQSNLLEVIRRFI